MIELIIALIVLSFMLPNIYSWLYRSIKSTKLVTIHTDISNQLDFVVSTIEERIEDAESVQVESNRIIIVSSGKQYEIGLRKKRIYQRQNAYRYLTIFPVEISELEFNLLTDEVFQMVVRADNKRYEFLFRLVFTEGES